MCDYRTLISFPLYNKKGSDYDITASVDLQDVAQVQQFNASNNVATSNPASSSGVKRSVSGTWNKPARTNSQAEAEQLLSSPKRTISTQTLEGKVSFFYLNELVYFLINITYIEAFCDGLSLTDVSWMVHIGIFSF